MKVIIYNDTSRAFGRIHFGCQLVMESLHDLLEDFDIIGSVSLDDARMGNIDKSLLLKADLIIANGEGSYHHNNRPDFARLSKDYPVALINTVYQDNSDDLNYFKYISARESKSRDEIEKQVPCDLVPDVIFSSRYLESIKPKIGGGVVSVQHYPMLHPVPNSRSVSTLQKKEAVVPFIASADKVVTGSFHAGCIASYYGKPLFMSKSNTHKMEGLEADLNPDYVSAAKQKIKDMINKLGDL